MAVPRTEQREQGDPRHEGKSKRNAPGSVNRDRRRRHRGAALLRFVKRSVVMGGTKLAAKTALCSGGVGGSTIAGATAGSFLGPAGTAVGGLIGTGIGWFATAYVVIKADEYLNRDEFEARLHKVIDEGTRNIEARFKQRLSRRGSQISNRTSDEMRKANLQPG